MLREQAPFFRRASIIFDFLILFLALWLAYLIRSRFAGLSRPFSGYLWILAFAAPVWYALMARYGFFGSIRRLSIYEITTRMINVHLAGGFMVAAAIFFLDKDEYSRGLYLAFGFFSFLLLTLEKISLRLILGAFRRRGYNIRNLLLVGTREKLLRFCQVVEEQQDWGLNLLGFIQVTDCPLALEFNGHPVLGHIDDIVSICKGYPVDEVIFCLPKSLALHTEKYLRELEELGITVRMLLDFYEVSYAKKEMSLFQELPFLTFHSKSMDAQQIFLKRVIDIAGALVGLGLLAVLFPFLALAIRLDSPGPIFFGQERVGESGRIFRCWKFRSMLVDAEERKQELMVRNEMSGAIFKIKNDPRITRVGKFLRKSSLDEFPQFWNVLRGEMSLVGTRPPTPAEVAEYQNWHRRRISIKPGITGKWQISGRNRIDDFDRIVRLDLDYIDNWSVWLDLQILFRTVVVVFRREGSC